MNMNPPHIKVYFSSEKEKELVMARAAEGRKPMSKHIRDLLLMDIYTSRAKDISSTEDIEFFVPGMEEDRTQRMLGIEPATPIQPIRPKSLLKDGDTVSIDEIFDVMGVKV